MDDVRTHEVKIVAEIQPITNELMPSKYPNQTVAQRIEFCYTNQVQFCCTPHIRLTNTGRVRHRSFYWQLVNKTSIISNSVPDGSGRKERYR